MKRPYLSSQQAQQIKDQAFHLSEKLQVPIALTILDNGGHIIIQARTDQATSLSLEASRKKARLSGELKQPSHVLFQIAQKEPALGMVLAKELDFLLLPGGIPIIEEGFCIGSLGISGGNYQQDQEIAERSLASMSN